MEKSPLDVLCLKRIHAIECHEENPHSAAAVVDEVEQERFPVDRPEPFHVPAAEGSVRDSRLRNGGLIGDF